MNYPVNLNQKKMTPVAHSSECSLRTAAIDEIMDRQRNEDTLDVLKRLIAVQDQRQRESYARLYDLPVARKHVRRKQARGE